jgi:hypothetical protein
MFCASAMFAIVTVAQAPQSTQSGVSAAAGGRIYPAPTNLKALPRTMTGEQVHEVMEQWESQLGVHCNTCHAADPNNLAPNGRPRLNYADDSKPEKATARMMFSMTEEINRSYVSKVEGSGIPVTCGTCHRGHFGPVPFVPES